MDWMLTHQLSSKNLSTGEKLAMTEEFQKEVTLENEKKRLEGNSKGGSSNNEVSLQLECNLKEDDPVRKDSWTDSQTASVSHICYADKIICLYCYKRFRYNTCIN